jgi:hypothetical protein
MAPLMAEIVNGRYRGHLYHRHPLNTIVWRLCLYYLIASLGIAPHLLQ